MILIDAYQRHDWLMVAVEKRLRELGCVKTRRRGEPIEWTFRQIAISAVRIL